MFQCQSVLQAYKTMCHPTNIVYYYITYKVLSVFFSKTYRNGSSLLLINLNTYSLMGLN